MPGRTDNQVKNRFNSTLRRLIASQKKDGSAGVDVGDERERRFVVAAKGAVATAIANGR